MNKKEKIGSKVEKYDLPTFVEDLTHEELLELLEEAEKADCIPFDVVKKKYLGDTEL